ncbi:hypothetical protein Snoj_44160 [Streptomyces nojiriensis]|uniref:Uncharacterized protein n=1 Tax=Streptomyces nojiriensis TaxID=66374 RepID=A0ABQ3SQS7_9ACTN|nr:hypothetical protein [Streptomyces nojiriensis]QTI44047.1 hypothetical protein JYK04_01810 [Streptomyces nojiriensis]GGR85749.1 hypothetical protein GCM10010205_12820 [Streptomyces nojiriensis]GHI70498.1 hypothetical protein Snoj_44160 [Streptomyces nojiriensis]
MSGIDWDEEFTRLNPAPPEKPSTSSKFSATIGKVGGVRRNTAALAVCGTIAVLAVCGTVVAVTGMQGEQAAQDRARAREQAANALVEVEADKQRAQTEEAAAKALYEREMAVYLECMKIRAAAVAKAASYEVSKIPPCAAPTLGGGVAAKKQDEATGADSALTSSPWLWVALVGGAGLVAYKKLSASTAAGSGSGAVAAANDKGFTFEKGA